MKKLILVLLCGLLSTSMFSQKVTLKQMAEQKEQWSEYSNNAYNVVCKLVNVEPGSISMEKYRITMGYFTLRYEIPYEYDGSSEVNTSIINHPIDIDLYNKHVFDYSNPLIIEHQDEDHAILKHDDSLPSPFEIEHKVQDFSEPKLSNELKPVNQ